MKDLRPSGAQFSFAAFARSLQLPEDYAKGNILVTMQGQEHLVIENFKGISSYTEEEICLVTRKKRIRITGRRLKVDCFTKDEIEISGVIEKLEYC